MGDFDASREAGKLCVEGTWKSTERLERWMVVSFTIAGPLALVAAFLAQRGWLDVSLAAGIAGVPVTWGALFWRVIKRRQAGLPGYLRHIQECDTQVAARAVTLKSNDAETKKRALEGLIAPMLDQVLQPHETTRDLEKEKLSAYSRAGLLPGRRHVLRRPGSAAQPPELVEQPPPPIDLRREGPLKDK